MVMSRIEEFDATGPTPGSNMRVKIGARTTAQSMAAEAELKFEAGRVSGFAGDGGRDVHFRPVRLSEHAGGRL